jgi:hypothetical protein
MIPGLTALLASHIATRCLFKEVFSSAVEPVGPHSLDSAFDENALVAAELST